MAVPSQRRIEEEADNSELLLLAHPDLYSAWLILIRGEYLLHSVGGSFMVEPEASTAFKPEEPVPGSNR